SDSGEVRVKGMHGKASMVRRFTEHGAQLSRSALGDVPVRVAISGLKGTRHETAVAGCMLGALEATHVGKDSNRGQGDDRSDSRHRLEPPHDFAHALSRLS